MDGATLRDAISRDPETILGAASTPGSEFPLLIKYLDAASSLSVQVHPSRDYARRHPAARPKDEAWVIIDAPPGAAIIRGFDPSRSRREIETLLEQGRIVDAMVRVPVAPGDCIVIPSGIVHALAGGIVVAEIGTASDTTFRLWDWGRNDPARPLQPVEALECLSIGASQRLERIPPVREATAPAIEASGFRTVPLCRAEHFEIESIAAIERSASLEVITDGSPVAWMVLSGCVRFDGPRPGAPGVTAGAWTTVLLPAASQGLTARMDAGTRWLRVTIPGRMGPMLADER